MVSVSVSRAESAELLLFAYTRCINPFPPPGIPHGAPLGRRTRPAAAYAAPEVPW